MKLRLLLPLMLGSLTSCTCAPPGHVRDSTPMPQERPMSTPPSSSRPPSPRVPPVVHEGVRYEEDRTDERQGDQPGGFLVAVDARTGERLWRLKVYELQPGPGAPTGGAIAFRALRLADGGGALDLEDETGVRYRVDLTSRTAARVGGTPIDAPPRPPVPDKPKD